MSEEEYVLEPVDVDFTNEALAEMRTYLDRLPTYRRSDGSYVLPRDLAWRDSVVNSGLQDAGLSPSDNLVVLRITGVTFSSLGGFNHVQLLADFITWCQARWPCKLYGMTDGLTTVREFLAFQLRSALS
jgi:hypothetical protein